ncbi:hypothetical protein [Rhizobium sp. S163]|uniref:hypothetical protein n=1 Tax=Rhizobium sp. S163 TaxID=3055039 RepID=UPI0025A945DE|nr:hypothetical protein [Rhizobium sp. S163]MDM9647748.1 hypothetical protein [Rhizobium sp. S163]
MATAKTTKAATEGKTKTVIKVVVTAPAGPRRRAGYSFGPIETALTKEELGEKAEQLIEAWRADPMLKVDAREFEEPDTDPDAEQAAE